MATADGRSPPPLLVLGVRRSGTTMLRVMLDRNSRLAVPDESYFIPQLAHRHRGGIRVDDFVEDARRLETIQEWGISPDEMRQRLRDGVTAGAAISALFAAYAERQGKERWGDKTPLYMQHLPLLERLFPEARFVHLIRDGRDAAVSFLSMPEGIVTRSWAHPRSAAEFARQWRTEVEDARRLGRRVGDRFLEVRYEALVADPEAELHRVCEFADLPWEPGMLEYPGTVEISRKPHLQRLSQPPTPGARDWRTELSGEDALAFEEVAGDVLASLGYDLVRPGGSYPTPRGRLRLGRYRLALGAWNGMSYALQRSPAWRSRHPRLQ